MYSAVPPAGYVEKSSGTTAGGEKAEQQPEKPRHVQDHQWKRFCELRARREELSSGAAKRTEATRNKTLRHVSQKLSEADRKVLKEEGVSLPRVGRRKGRRREREREREGEGDTEGRGKAEAEWQEVRRLMDPNPQLKGVDPGKYAPKSLLEEDMDESIERGEFEEAVDMSEKLAQREFSSKVTTAFECREYVKRKKIEEEWKKRKPPKLHWRFEPKRPWEMKGNM